MCFVPIIAHSNVSPSLLKYLKTSYNQYINAPFSLLTSI